MTTHQDNAARLSRITQIAAIVVAVAAVAAFLIPLPAGQINTSPRGGAGNGATPPGGADSSGKFKVEQEDWIPVLASIGAFRDPPTRIADATPDITEEPPEDPEFNNNPENNPQTRNRPPIRYLGALDDSKGAAALIDFAGKQHLLRVGQEFEDEFEIIEITDEDITVTDGFQEYTFPLASSTLATAPPSPPVPGARNNKLGRPPQQQLGRPSNPDSSPRRPNSSPNDDEGGSPT